MNERIPQALWCIVFASEAGIRGGCEPLDNPHQQNQCLSFSPIHDAAASQSAAIYLAKHNQPRYDLYQLLLTLVLFGCLLGNFQASGQTLSSPTELLEKMRQAESAAGQSLTPWPRYFRLEARSLSGTLLARSGIETLYSKNGKIAVIRLYDSNNVLQAGEWRFSDGTRRTFNNARTPRIILVSTAASEAKTNLNYNNIWLYLPASENFQPLLQASRQTVVEESLNNYTVNLRLESPAQTRGLVKASLVLRRTDMLPVQQTLLVEDDAAITEYLFSEIPAKDWLPHTLLPDVAALDTLALGKTALPSPSDLPFNTAHSQPPATTPLPGSAFTAATPVVITTPEFYEVGSLQGKAIRREAPIYPKVARNAQVGGLVKVFLELDAQGQVVSIRGAEGPALLRDAALVAIRGWRFAPSLIDSRAVRVIGYVLFQFTP